MKVEAAPYVHGYYEWDWADGIMEIAGKNSTPGPKSDVLYWSSGVTQASKPNARYFGLNLLSELDAPGEYYVSRDDGLLYYLPPVPINEWDNATGIPTFSVNETAIYFAPNTSSVNVSGVTVSHATGTGVYGMFFILHL